MVHTPRPSRSRRTAAYGGSTGLTGQGLRDAAGISFVARLAVGLRGPVTSGPMILPHNAFQTVSPSALSGATCPGPFRQDAGQIKRRGPANAYRQELHATKRVKGPGDLHRRRILAEASRRRRRIKWNRHNPEALIRRQRRLRVPASPDIRTGKRRSMTRLARTPIATAAGTRLERTDISSSCRLSETGPGKQIMNNGTPARPVRQVG